MSFLESQHLRLAGLIQWSLNEVKPGETGSVSYSVAVAEYAPYFTNTLTNQAVIQGYDKDRNYDDNYASGSFTITRFINTFPFALIPGFAPAAVAGAQPAIKIDKRHYDTDGIVQVGEPIDYTIEFTNRGSGSAYDVFLIDDLVDPDGKNVNSQGWRLGEVFVGETIIVDYTVTISQDAKPGVYTNSAQVLMYNKEDMELYSHIVETTILVDNPHYRITKIIEEALGIVDKSPEIIVITTKTQRIEPPTDDTLLDLIVTPAEASTPEILGLTTRDGIVQKFTFPWFMTLFALFMLIVTYVSFAYLIAKKPF